MTKARAIVFDTESLRNVEGQMTGRQFAHGGTRVTFIAGPIFDEATAGVPSAD